MGGTILEKTAVERDIGVIVNSDLKPIEQCAKAAKTANAVLGQISRAFHYRDRWTFVRLYKLYVRPHLEFASPAWSPWTNQDKECLEKVQRRAIAMVSGLGDKNYLERLKELKMTTLEARREEIDMTETFKILNGHNNVDWNLWFTKNEAAMGGRETRSAADPHSLRIPPSRLELRRNFFSLRVIEKWNNLPSEVKSAQNVKQFKMAYRLFMDNCSA